MEAGLGRHRRPVVFWGSRLGALGVGVLLAYSMTFWWRGGPPALALPTLLIVSVWAGVVMSSRRLERPGRLGQWGWALLPLAFLMPLLWYVSRIAHLLQHEPNAERLAEYAAGITLLSAIYIAWTVGFPVEKSFGPVSGKKRALLRASLGATGVALLAGITVHAFSLAAQAEGTSLALQASKLLRWAETAAFLVSAFFFVRLFVTAVALGGAGQAPLDERKTAQDSPTVRNVLMLLVLATLLVGIVLMVEANHEDAAGLLTAFAALCTLILCLYLSLRLWNRGRKDNPGSTPRTE